MRRAGTEKSGPTQEQLRSERARVYLRMFSLAPSYAVYRLVADPGIVPGILAGGGSLVVLWAAIDLYFLRTGVFGEHVVPDAAVARRRRIAAIAIGVIALAGGWLASA